MKTPQEKRFFTTRIRRIFETSEVEIDKIAHLSYTAGLAQQVVQWRR